MDITQKCYHKPSEKARAFNDFSQVFSGFQSKNPFWPKTGNLLMNTPPKIKPSGFWADWGRWFIRRPLWPPWAGRRLFSSLNGNHPHPKKVSSDQTVSKRRACDPKGHRQAFSRTEAELCSAEQRVDCPALPGPVQVIWATGERAVLSKSGQEQKLSLQSVLLNTERYQPKQRQATSLFSL